MTKELLPKPIKDYNLSIGANFDSETHTYTDNLGTKYSSGSAVVKSFFPFSKDIKVDPKKSKAAREYGTYIHELCENYFLTGEIINYEEYGSIYDYLMSIEDTVIGSEVQLFLPELGICGTCDVLSNENGKFILRDFKTNKSLQYDNGKASFPLDFVDHNPINGYYFQMSVYAYILWKTYGIKCEEIEIVHILRPVEENNNYKVECHRSRVKWGWVEEALPHFDLRDIIIDTREQAKLPFDIPFRVEKLDEGDYTTDFLKDKYVIERKSPMDLYASIIQNHERFRAEILRAKEKRIEIEIWTECPKKTFISKSWGGKSFQLQTAPKVLANILKTMEERYKIKFKWFENREQMRDCMQGKFVEKTQEHKSL